MSNISNWVKTNDGYNREVVTCDVWSKEISKTRKIYIQDSAKNNFLYTFSCGANSDFSFSGSFYNTTITTLTDAINWIEEFAPLWFSNDLSAIRDLKESIKKFGE